MRADQRESGDKAERLGLIRKAADRGYQKECLAWLLHDTWPERWGAQEKIFVPPPIDAGSIFDGYLGMAEQTRVRQAEEQEAPLDQVDQDHHLEVATMPEAEQYPIKLPFEVSAEHTLDEADQDTPWVEDVSEVHRDQVPALRGPVKGSLPRKKPQGKQKVLANGRSSTPPPNQDKWHAQIFPLVDICRPAWRHLSKAATDIYIVCRAKSGQAASKGQKDASGLPVFSFPLSVAVRDYGLSKPTVIKAFGLLREVGFIKYAMCGDRPMSGGIVNGAGIPAKFVLSNEWKVWEPFKKDASRHASNVRSKIESR